jgi:WD40 repeat protein
MVKSCIRCWLTRTRSADVPHLAVLEGHKGPVVSVGWRPDCALFLGGAAKFGLVLLWPADLKTSPPPALRDWQAALSRSLAESPPSC